MPLLRTVVAIARRGGIDVLTNEVSKRLTATMVGFSGKERKLGEQALSGVRTVTEPASKESVRCAELCGRRCVRGVQITSNLKNTITGMKAILGKKFHSEDIQSEMDLVGYRMVDKGGNVGIPVNYNDDEVMLTPERATAMLLKCLQKIAEEDQKGPVTDVVLSVRVALPCFSLSTCSSL